MAALRRFLDRKGGSKKLGHVMEAAAAVAGGGASGRGRIANKSSGVSSFGKEMDGIVDRELAAELHRQEQLYEVHARSCCWSMTST